MKEFLEMMAFLVFVAFIFGMVFVFQGTPDLWDKWHERAMADTACAQVPQK